MAWTPRFDGHPRAARVVLVLVGLLIVWGVLTGSRIPATAISDNPDKTDSAMYGAIVDRMNDGLGYYAAVAKEQPARGYPTSPSMNVREPTLAWVTSKLGDRVMIGILWLLALVAIGMSIWIYERTERTKGSWVAATVLAAVAIGIFAFPGGVHVHEVWLSLLICVGLLARGVGWIRTSMALLLVAALIRELVAPVMLVMLVVSWVTGRRREAWAWAGCLSVFWIFYAVHLFRVHELAVGPSADSPSWVAVGGWPFIVDAVRASTVLALLPFWVAGILVPIGLLGWVARSGNLFDAIAAFLVTYSVLFCVVGRNNNGYWGSFVGILLLPGIAFGLEFLSTELRRSARRSRRILADR